MDDHTLFDYSVGLNEIVQILVQKPVNQDNKTSKENLDSDKENEEVTIFF